MANKTRSHDPGRKYAGTWPGGEPKSVRDAYDQQLADQKAANEQKSGK